MISTASRDELFAFDYPAPARRSWPRKSSKSVKPVWVGLDRDQWGLDHGTWSVLAHLYPDADMPVVQLSINALKPLDYHVELGRALAPLRDEGIMIVASGNVVHNLGRGRVEQARCGASTGQSGSTTRSREQLASISRPTSSRCRTSDYELAVPTPDHFIPLAVHGRTCAVEMAAAAASSAAMRLGSLSMTCYGVGMDGARVA